MSETLIFPNNEQEFRAFTKLYTQSLELTLKNTENQRKAIELLRHILEEIVAGKPLLEEKLREAGIFLSDKNSELGEEFLKIGLKLSESEESFIKKLEEKFTPYFVEIKKANDNMLVIKIILLVLGSISVINFMVSKVLPLLGLN